MKLYNPKSITSRKNRIVNSLILNASFMNNLGILNGKMGISICFYHMAKKYSNSIYFGYAEDLINDIYDELDPSIPLDFENGLAGIGWGFEYLVQEGFIEADTDEILKDFDNKIFQYFIYNTPNNLSLENGILGFAMYFFIRVKNSSSQNSIQFLRNKEALIHIVDELVEFFSKKTKLFDQYGNQNILYEYPILISLLRQIYKQNIYPYKVEVLIKMIFSHLNEPNRLSIINYNKSILYLSLIQLDSDFPAKFFNPEILKTYGEWIKAVNKNDLLKTQDNPSVKSGVSGILWMYIQLFNYTSDKKYFDEAILWFEEIFTSIKNVSNQSFAGFSYFEDNNNNDAFGIINGLSGVLMVIEEFQGLYDKN